MFAPANGFHGRCYEPLASCLRDHFQCVGVDLEGQGDTPANLDSPVNMLERHADDLLAIVDHFNQQDCYVFGHSGGGLAALMAEQHRPGTFKAMYLYEPVVFGPESAGADEQTNAFVDLAKIRTAHAAFSPDFLAVRALKRRRRFASKAAALQSFASKPPFQDFQSSALSAYIEHGLRELSDGTVELKCTPEVEARIYTDVWEVGRRTFGRLRDVKCPVTIAAGAEVVPGRMMAGELEAPRIAAQLSLGRFEQYRWMGHFGPFDSPAFVADRVIFNFYFSRNAVLWNTLPKAQSERVPRSRL
ncbi:Uncharacterized hydrolase SAV2581 at N-terminal half [Coccomyxa sp. Obi]|nr:Uncharacterized hydrolase SAV2581 at N-terminal half [Coccomyxa sp. Obi]